MGPRKHHYENLMEATESQFCTVMLEKTLESPLDCKEIKPVERTHAEAETPVLWPPDVK